MFLPARKRGLLMPHELPPMHIGPTLRNRSNISCQVRHMRLLLLSFFLLMCMLVAGCARAAVIKQIASANASFGAPWLPSGGGNGSIAA